MYVFVGNIRTVRVYTCTFIHVHSAHVRLYMYTVHMYVYTCTQCTCTFIHVHSAHVRHVYAPTYSLSIP